MPPLPSFVSAPAPRQGRRRALRSLLSAALVPLASAGPARAADRGEPFTVATFGDSILDCGRYNVRGVHPGGLIVRNDDRLFPEFRGRDLTSGGPAKLVHRALDGARVADLSRQLEGLKVEGRAVALLTIGGNDLLAGLAADAGKGIAEFERTLAAFLAQLSIRPVLVGTVYDPTFGDDARNFLTVEPSRARANLARINAVLAEHAARHGRLVDVHRHFLGGDPEWYTRTIEPSLTGASEIRRVFLPAVEATRG